jgi:hypothetical protein
MCYTTRVTSIALSIFLTYQKLCPFYTTVLWHSKEFSKVSYLKLCKEFEGMIEKNSAQKIRFLEGGEFMENVLIRSPNFKSGLLGT